MPVPLFPAQIKSFSHFCDQVVDAVMSNPDDKTKVTLLYANNTVGAYVCVCACVGVRECVGLGVHVRFNSGRHLKRLKSRL